MPRKRFDIMAALGAAILGLAPGIAQAKEKPAPDAFAPSAPAPLATSPASGAIFGGSFTPLTSGGRAGQVGDILTIQLVERTSASKSSGSATQRDGDISLTPPATGPLSFFNPTDIGMGGGQQFKGQGNATQANTLSGEITVTVAAVYPNGTMLVRGQKLLTLNRGDEWVQISGLVRAIDIGTDNRIASTRIADATIRFTGKGDVARASRQGWLQRFFSMISPF
jgi:flagellar L-ring protein precursor FlgH